MKTIKSKLKQLFGVTKAPVSMDELIAYPKDSLGFHLGIFLFDNRYEADPVPEKEDIYRVLITRELSGSEEIAMHYYLFGNGYTGIQTLFFVAAAPLLYPHRLRYFYRRYHDGRNALRFYDLDHFRMLHLPLTRIKDTFLIR